MRLSKDFLSDYIDLSNIPYSEVAEKMVFAGNEYESIEKLCNAKGLVVGYIEDCVNHPESDHLHICKVNIGSETVQILCGAPNVAKGQKVIVATIGAELPGGVIKKAKLAGMESHGMICSMAELGLESKYLKEEDHAGIHVLDADAKVGEDALHYLGFDDEIIDFELTADRADLLNIIGMAYEIGAIYNQKVTLPNIKLHETKENICDIMKLDVRTDNCPIYLGKMVKNVEIKESPKFIKNRLMASGIRPINNVVDISNYVMLEYGQPLHFFDKDKLGNTVVVRMANEGEMLNTLDGKARVLKTSDIVIANEKEPVALAGVMGGLETEIENDTKNIFIEAAIFNPLRIRYTSKAIIRSEASIRYEKGVDPSRTILAMNRACELLEQYANAEIYSGILMHDIASKEDKKIEVSLEKIVSVLGMNITKEDVEEILTRLGFTYKIKYNIFEVYVPTRRIDVNIKEDVIAEIGKIYGYDKVVGSLPTNIMKKGTYSKKEQLEKNVRRHLRALGLNQVITYSLVSENEINIFHNEKYEPVILESPMSEDRKVMRTSLIPSLLHVYDYNSARNRKDIHIFETSAIYYKENDEYKENMMLSGLLSGVYEENTWQRKELKVDFYLVKGIVENLLDYLGLHNRYQFSLDNLVKELHPGMSASIIIDRNIIGFIGRVHPSICKKEVYVFELDLKKILELKVKAIKFKEIPKYPSVKKDVSFIVKEDVTSKEVEDVIKKAGSRLLTNIDVFDVYVGENVGKDEKSIAYALTFRDPNKTLNDEEVTVIFNKIIEEVTKKLDAVLRNK